MLKKWTTSLLCLLIACYGYSQTTSADSTVYPCYIQYHGQTVGAFTIPQMQHIARTYYLLDDCDSVATELVSERESRRALDARSDSIVAYYQAIAQRDESTFAQYQRQLSLNSDEMASMRRQARLARIKSKLLGCGIGIPVAAGAGLGAFILGAFLKPKL